MIEKIITENSVETLIIRWDGERFALIERGGDKSKVIILNPREMLDLVNFACEVGEE